jgi:hypothetical protein
MDLNIFENDISCQNFNINFNKIAWKKFKLKKKFVEDFFKNILRIF